MTAAAVTVVPRRLIHSNYKDAIEKTGESAGTAGAAVAACIDTSLRSDFWGSAKAAERHSSL